MKTAIGKIVIFHCSEEQKDSSNNYQKDAPAIITAAWSENLVNLKVIFDGEKTLWVTSVHEGTQPMNWSWPDQE